MTKGFQGIIEIFSPFERSGERHSDILEKKYGLEGYKIMEIMRLDGLCPPVLQAF